MADLFLYIFAPEKSHLRNGFLLTKRKKSITLLHMGFHARSMSTGPITDTGTGTVSYYDPIRHQKRSDRYA